MDTNENRNGVVRKILPKGSPFDAILDEEMRRIDRMLNDRPLKRLDWRTPSRAGPFKERCGVRPRQGGGGAGAP